MKRQTDSKKTKFQ